MKMNSMKHLIEKSDFRSTVASRQVWLQGPDHSKDGMMDPWKATSEPCQTPEGRLAD
jgi:hypothetical protein